MNVVTNKSLNKFKIKFGDGTQILLKDMFNLFYPELTIFVEKFIPDKSICEDIVQDFFVSFCERKNTFPSLKALKAYFYASIRNRCLDYLKHAKIEKKYVETSMYLRGENEYFFDQIVKNEAYSIIYNEINKLPEMGKKVLLLALKEYSNDEIANELNIALNTVKTHKARAYKVLRKKIGSLAFFLIFK
uniref:sigma-70 family RNA polymerase sigma factor n=1 Tax=uncultured Draconibacterium sp. TaxID=1573823 RepID=UPI0032164062